MKRGRIFSITAMVALIGFTIGTMSHAGFIDDWITQKAETSPGYMEGQKRGYFTGGSFSARWPQNKDYLATFEPPRLNFGCGGIDAFMGGFSFMNFEYLVQKLQRVLQAAPAAAFDLALKNLCEPCSNVIKSMEAMSDALNSLQLDDCKAGKVIAAKIMDPFTDNPKVQQEAEKDYGILQGIYDLPHKITDIWKGNGGKPERTRTEMLSGCPAEVRAIYDTSGTSILQNIFDRRGYNAQHVEVMRGLIGDVMVSNYGDNQNGWNPVTPCPDSKPADIFGFYTGRVYKRPLSGNDYGACALVTDTNANLQQWAHGKLIAVYGKMLGKSGTLTAEEQSFVDTMPPPTLSALKVAIASKQGNEVLASLSVIIAKAYAFGMLKDIYGDISQGIQIAEAQMVKQGQGKKADCQIELVTPIIDPLKEMRKQTMNLLQTVQADYANSTKEHLAVLDLARRYEEFNKISFDRLSKAFSPGLAKRVMGGR
ncbi:MAG TPA: hypothetical protein DDZ40_04480 [Deltaproteobacteria bacterium]|nr:hypothetical protein [Deltaproteobacteria bacterium]